ncbi:methyltransferase domain-containing protein [Candidatus Dojkabacteria bacterium]|uniref:Methyltransferase domain-containing protein n=1 Tax=Candidatus Dojkabacteria bacterium TaxID=2099670 RepID=A0A955I6B0_9BACT|nr:methyltransferase domain-containing protein [Candidatus Dojkabacteria bacterium]
MPKQVVKLPPRPEGEVEVPVDTSRAIQYVTFFGDSALPEESQIYQDVWQTAKLLAEQGFAIVDGGGPGVMKAATDGAEAANGHTVAIYWEPKMASIFEGKNLSNLTDESDSYSNYMMRTLGLIEKGHVYVVCKGGTGTISEFGMVWALAKLYYGKHKPVILYGEFWEELIECFQKAMILDDNELGVLHYAKTPEEVLKLVEAFEIEVQAREKHVYSGEEQAFVLSPQVAPEEVNRLVELYKESRATNIVAKNQLEEFIGLVQPPAKVLEIGCGTGHDAQFLANKYSVTAFDISEEAVELTKLENPGIDAQVADVLQYEFPENTYKGVWARDVLHHVPGDRLDEVFTKISRSLVEEGIFYVIVREGEGEADEKDMLGGKEIVKHYHYFSEAELLQRAQMAGLELVKLEQNTRSHKWLVGVFRKVS